MMSLFKKLGIGLVEKTQEKTIHSFRARMIAISIMAFLLLVSNYLFMMYLHNINENFYKLYYDTIRLNQKIQSAEFAIRAVDTCITANYRKDENAQYYCDFAVQNYINNYDHIGEPFEAERDEVVARKAYYKMILDLDSYIDFIKNDDFKGLDKPFESKILEFLVTPLGYFLGILVLIIVYMFLYLVLKGVIKVKHSGSGDLEIKIEESISKDRRDNKDKD